MTTGLDDRGVRVRVFVQARFNLPSVLSRLALGPSGRPVQLVREDENVTATANY
jgi:hypothetical protein